MKRRIFATVFFAFLLFCANSENFMLKAIGEDYNKIKIHNYSSMEKIQGVVKKMSKTRKGVTAPVILDSFILEGFDSEISIKGKIKEDEYFIVVLGKAYEGKLKASLSYKNLIGYDTVYINFEDK